MSKFKITWTGGKTSEYETASDCETVDQYAMQRWGQDSATQVYKDFGVHIERIEDGDPVDAKRTAVLASKDAVAVKTESITANKAQIAAPRV